MKKYLSRFSLAVLTAVLATGIYFGCTKDDENLSFDLTGRWSGWGASAGGTGHAELQINQDTTGRVSGFIYMFDEKMDTVPFAGTLSDDHFTGTAYDVCRPTIKMKIENDGVKLVGTARDLDSASCNTNLVYLLFYKVIPATENVSGSWTGTHSSTDTVESGSFTMSLSQTGNDVTGTLTDDNGSTAVTGRVLGNVFEGVIHDEICDILVYMEISRNSANGLYTGGNRNEECKDRGTVTISRAVGKQIRK